MRTHTILFTLLALGWLHVIWAPFSNAETTQEVVQRSNLVIPKKSVGFLEFGMSADAVRSKLGRPKISRKSLFTMSWTYTSKDQSKILVLDFWLGEKGESTPKLTAIQFNSPTFKLQNNASVIQSLDFYSTNSAWKAGRASKRSKNQKVFSFQAGGLTVYGGGGDKAVAAIATASDSNYKEPDAIFFQIGSQPRHLAPMTVDIGNGEGKVELSATVLGKGFDSKLNEISFRRPGGKAKEIDISECDNVDFSVSNAQSGNDVSVVSGFLESQDYNFDGYADLSLVDGIGGTGSNTSHCYFLYDKKYKTFVYSKDFSELATVELYPKTKTVISHNDMCGGGECYDEETYKVVNGALQHPPISKTRRIRVESETSSDTSEFCTFVTKDGKTRLTEGKPENCKNEN
jgi:outer membrane protein assembly factor BamE (lipoprotein component of BamABCDE complex)